MKSTNKLALAVIGLVMISSPLTYAQTATGTSHDHDQSATAASHAAPKKPAKSKRGSQDNCMDKSSMNCNDHGNMSDDDHQKMMQKHMDDHQNMMKQHMQDHQNMQMAK